MDSIVVVGASLGGLRFVEGVRREGYSGSITLIGDDPERPYDRPPLSKEYLRGAVAEDRLALRRKPYDALELELRLGRPARSLDLSGREVEIEGGERVGYDALVVATGARPRTLPGLGERRGVHVLRTLEDARRLREALGASRRVVIIGAGFIGLEVAATARTLGLDVSVLEAAEWPCSRALHPELGAFLTHFHRARGVELRCGVRFEAVEGEDAVEAIRLEGGERIPADLVVVGVGVTPNVEWLEGSGLELENGVRCDETLRASAEGVYAIGDVASFPHSLFGGERMRVEHWTTTVEQARHVAKAIARGERAAFTRAPFFWSDQFELKIQGAGRPLPGDRMEIVHGSLEEGRFVALFGREGRLVGAYGFGRPAELIKARAAIEERASFDEALAAAQGSSESD